MKTSTRDRFADQRPLELPSAISGYEKESQEAEAKLADARKARKKSRAKKKGKYAKR